MARNVLTDSNGATLQGGGLFTPGFKVTLVHSEVEKNVPDQCSGC